MQYFGESPFVPQVNTPNQEIPGQYKKPTPKKEHHWFKTFVFWIILLFFTGGFIVTASELVLRVIPGQWSNTFFHVYDPVLGTWHISSHTGDYKRQDFNIKGISINSFGMRDIERSLEKSSASTTRIAVLGDSFVEAFHVTNDQTFTQLLEDRYGGRVEVLNFGVAGFGTLQEYLTYKERVRQFKPDIVVLAFLSSNDMRNNSRALEDAYTGTKNIDRPFPDRLGTSSWQITPPQAKPSATNPAILFLKKHFTLYRFLWYSKGTLQAKYATVKLPEVSSTTPATGTASTTALVATTTQGAATSSTQKSEEVSVYIAKLFAPPKEQPFIDAWEATEWSIKSLKDEVVSDGAKFILFTLPDATKMEKDPRTKLEEEYKAKLPKEWDIDYPEKRLAQFAKANNIAFFDLTPGFRKERDIRNLSSPYFSYEHDGHWAPVGHKLAADLIHQYFAEKYNIK